MLALQYLRRLKTKFALVILRAKAIHKHFPNGQSYFSIFYLLYFFCWVGKKCSLLAFGELIFWHAQTETEDEEKEEHACMLKRGGKLKK